MNGNLLNISNEKSDEDKEYIDSPELAYAKNVLNSREVADEDGREYTEYSLNGTSFIFRNRNNYPIFNSDYPVSFIGEPSGQENNHPDASLDGVANTLVSTPSPEGILRIAEELSESVEVKKNLESLRDDIINQKYHERSIFLFDTIAAASYNLEQGVNLDGLAVAVAALSGEDEAKNIMFQKLDEYYERHNEKKNAAQRHFLEWFNSAKNNEQLNPEAFNYKEISLVHSTQHPVERDSEGNLILYSASYKREDKFPRSTIHFVPNAEVESHSFGNWGNEKRLIVTPLAGVLDKNGVPAGGSEVDTFFVVNPGDYLTLPGAKVIEARGTGELLAVESPDLTVYLDKENYTEEEELEILDLAREYGVIVYEHSKFNDVLRKVTLRKVLSAQGVKHFNDPGGHYSFDPVFQRKYGNLMRDMGVRQYLHSDSPEASVEGYMGSDYVYHEYASIESHRTLAASGFASIKERYAFGMAY